MTPLDFAQSLSRSDVLADRALGAAIVLRGLTDDDPHDATRQGWPLNADTAERAIRWLGLTPDPEADRGHACDRADHLGCDAEPRPAMTHRPAMGTTTRDNGPHSDAPLTEEQEAARTGRPWPKGDK